MGTQSCPHCEGTYFHDVGNNSIGEQHLVCDDCGETMYYYCKADDLPER